MGLTISSSLLLIFFFFFSIFSTTPFYKLAFAKNQDLVSSTKADKGDSSQNLWCVAKNNAEDSALQKALDWACGPGGADCGPIQSGGPCYDDQNFQATASYAFNDYYIKHGSTDDACDFANTAALTSLNPSHENCKFPSSTLVVSNGSFVGSATAGGPGGFDTNGCETARWWGHSLITISIIYITISFLMRV